jgi:hypothetical protein
LSEELPLVVPGLEHLARPAAHRQEQVEAYPGDREVPIRGADEPLRARRKRAIDLAHVTATTDGFDASSEVPFAIGG